MNLETLIEKATKELIGNNFTDSWNMKAVYQEHAIKVLTTAMQEAYEAGKANGQRQFLKNITKIQHDKIGTPCKYIRFDEVGDVDWEKILEANI